MNITLEKVNALNAVVKIKLSPEDYQSKVEAAIKSHSKKANMPGFRKGMVPASHIKKLYGKSILVEEINNLLSDSLNNYINEEKLEVLGQPLPKEDDSYQPKWDYNESFEFSFELGMAPEIKETFSAKDKVTHYKVRIDEETLASRLKNIRRSYGKMSNPDVVTEEDVIYGELTQLSPDGTVFEGGIVNTASIRLDLIDDAKTKKSLVGLKKDDQAVIDIQKAYKNDAHQIARLLNVEEDMAKDLKSNFQLKVKNINRMEEADMNQEFFDKIYGPGAVDSEAAFIEKMKEELIGIMQENADRKLQTDLVAYGVDKFKINLPDEFLKRWLKLSNENKLSDQQIAEQYDDFAKNLKWTLMENRIMKDNAIEIQSQEVVDLAKKRIDAQFKMYSPQPLTEEQLEQYAMNFLQNREQSSRLLDEVRNQKVFEHLKTVITLESKEIDYNKFLELR